MKGDVDAVAVGSQALNEAGLASTLLVIGTWLYALIVERAPLTGHEAERGRKRGLLIECLIEEGM